MQFGIPSCAHTITNEDKDNTTLTSLYSHKVTVTWLVQALISEQMNTYPAISFSLSEHDTWSITDLIQ